MQGIAAPPFAVRLLLIMSLFALTAFGQGIFTSRTLIAGGPGGLGCQGPGDPPPLSGGTLAEASVEFLYNNVTGLLFVIVENTSPVTQGVPNPVITSLYFNLPVQALNGLTLLTQSAQVGLPAFNITIDTDTLDGSNPISASCFGEFGAVLDGPVGTAGGIGNAAADTFPGTPGSVVVGPVTFTFQVGSPNLETLTGGAFARGFSQNAALEAVNVVCEFEGGGLTGETGFIANGPDCAASGFFIGAPNIGEMVTLVQSGRPTCFGCIVASTNPGPTMVAGETYDIGLPVEEVSSGVSPSTSALMTPLLIPNDANLIGMTVFSLVVIADPPVTEISTSCRFVLTFLPPVP